MARSPAKLQHCHQEREQLIQTTIQEFTFAASPRTSTNGDLIKELRRLCKPAEPQGAELQDHP